MKNYSRKILNFLLLCLTSAADPYGDGKIYLLPAWPVKWNVNFKLHAPQQTVIEASVKNGKVVSLKVTPESWRKDVVLNPDFGR